MATLESEKMVQPAIVAKAYQAFFTPQKYETKPSEQAVLARGKTDRLPYAGGDLAATSWGPRQAPAVLLMHGWGGARAQMTGFVDPLLAAGYRAVAYDQPAHGDSSGEMTNLLEIAPTLDVVREQAGDFAAIVAHSFGTLVASYALVRRGFAPPARLVYFGALNRLMDSLPRFQALARLPDEVVAGLRDRIYENFGKDRLEAITNESLAAQVQIPALMFHDTGDKITPIEDSRAIARAWKTAELVETEGLGHRGALQSAAIHERVVGFLMMVDG